ncbi:MAG: hypothetical protein LBJ14_10385 [Desulfarculales bacterium]|jgi:hypothetical protein|nr:hypothetical protein [Desulfarculales bacterium]
MEKNITREDREQFNNMVITEFLGRDYYSLESATRALNNLMYSKVKVNHPMFSHLVAAVMLMPEMLDFTFLNGVFGISWTYTPADVLVMVFEPDKEAYEAPYLELKEAA